jgi:hypothetical protein
VVCMTFLSFCIIYYGGVSFEVLTAMMIQVTWVVMLCSVVVG